MSRETRDTLWLLGILAFVMMPHAWHLPWWSIAGVAAALLWRAKVAIQEQSLPPRRWLIYLLIALLGMTWLTYGTLMGREVGITLVVMLTTLKSLELKARRDALVCLYLGFFLIFTQFLFSQSIATAAHMLVGVWGLLVSLIWGQRPMGYPSIASTGKQAVRAMLWGMPLMVVLFLFFPRFGPLWALPADASQRTGLSDSMSLGDVASLVSDRSIAMRVKFLGTQPWPKTLYFRGPVLDQFDGKTWTSRTQTPTDEPVQFQGAALDYLATIEPTPLKTLALLDGTAQARIVHPTPAGNLTQHGLNWFRASQHDQRLQVQAQAFLSRQIGPTLFEPHLRLFTALPAGSSPATRKWLAQWIEQLRRDTHQPDGKAFTTPELIKALLQYIHTQDYRYTLSPGLPATVNGQAIDHFWLISRAGFCEHYASSFVAIMRMLDIPARVVMGYRGAEINPVDGLYVIRNANAHAWAEVWVPSTGWQRIDPTAEVPPERIDFSGLDLPFADLPGPLKMVDMDALRAWRARWEAVDHKWNEWILQYANDDQMSLLKRMGWENPDWLALGRTLAAALAVLGCGYPLMMYYFHRRQLINPSKQWLPLMQRLNQALSPLAPPPLGASPAAASTWHDHLQGHWGTINPQQQTLLKSLIDLDKLRYGSSASPMQSKKQRHLSPLQLARSLMKDIETQAKACQSID